METNMQSQQVRRFPIALTITIVLIILGFGVAYTANTKTPPVATADQSGMESSSTDMAMMGTGIAFKGGSIMLDENGTLSPLGADYVFSDGTKVSLAGVVTKTDGTTVQLKEGESVWRGGMILKAGEDMMHNESLAAADGAMGSMKAGLYTPYDQKLIANAATGKVVIFFHASWCPTCQALDADIRAHLSDIPSNVTILKADYDTSTALKKKYGVVLQSTYVQVDKNGNEIQKWSDTPSFAEFMSHIR